MKRKLSSRFWIVLTLFSLTGQIAWVVENMYLNVFIYKMFRATPADISLMVAASAISATLTTILMGALSDRVGRRKPFMCMGYILWGISILAFMGLQTDLLGKLFPAASAMILGAQLVILLDCIMTFFGSTANDAAFNAWLVDETNSDNRGSAEGINAMMPLVAMLVVFGGFMAFDLDRAESWQMIFLIIGSVVIVIGVAGFFLIQEKSVIHSDSSYIADIIYGFHPQTVKHNKSLYFYLATFVLFNISIQIFMPYLIIYYEVSLQMSNYVLIMAPAVILASVVTAFWGKVYDKKKFDFSIWIALLWLILGYVFLYCFGTTIPVFVGSLLMMSGYLSGMAVFGAKIRDLIPEGMAGRFQGVRIVSQVLIPGIIGPAIGKAILKNAQLIENNDGTTSFIPNNNIFLGALLVLVLLCILLLLFMRFRKPRLNESMHTPFSADNGNGWNEYPRPQLKRNSFYSLSGSWNLFMVKKEKTTPLGTIQVPFPPESLLSGIQRKPMGKEHYLYTKSFTAPSDRAGNRVILHFGAVDQIAEVSLNGHTIGNHTGGYLPFSFDVTEYLNDGENVLSVDVTDFLDNDLAYGKQRKKRGGMWYTPISGIWQCVWMETVPTQAIQGFKITPDLSGVTIRVDGGASEKELILKTEHGESIYHFSGDTIRIEPEKPHLWTPEDPYLYRFTLSSGKDVVESYFALRIIGIDNVKGKARLCLNHVPYFFHGLLDQGYFSDGIYTPKTPEGYRYDILSMKKLGFNMLRKHIKIEPELFYYYCDLYGMVVFQDMVNSGRYSFLIDTALPTFGLKRGIQHRASKKRKEHFEADAKATIDLLYNHPSVCYYTIFNEGWGQYDADGMYRYLKKLDPTRIYDATSGWFFEKESDVTSDHIYFKSLHMDYTHGRPMVLSEFGGYSCKVADHSFNPEHTYGYRFFEKTDEFTAALCRLYRTEVIPLIRGGLSAAVLTQVSDVEDETNGLVTYDREIIKVPEHQMQAIAAELFDVFYKEVT